MKPNESPELPAEYPRAEIALVKEFIREHDGEFTIGELWESLSQKMARETFDYVISFLQARGRISPGKNGKVKGNPFSEEAGSKHWSVREEANAIACFAFRNGFLEELHAGKHSELLEKPGLSRITNAEMKKLMIEASAKMEELLKMKEKDPAEYWRFIAEFNRTYCKHWKK